MYGELVQIFSAGRHGLLADERHAVLLDGDFEAVPVERGGFGQGVFKDDADAVALPNLDGRAGARTAVAPNVQRFERNDAALERFGGEAEDSHAAIHFVRQIGNIGRLYGTEGARRKSDSFRVRRARRARWPRMAGLWISALRLCGQRFA